MLTAKQVWEAIEEVDRPRGTYTYEWSTTPYEYDDYRDFYSNIDNGATMTLFIDGVEYEVEHVDNFGGMDMGTELWVVFRIGDQLFKKYGSYYSHDGSYWDGSLDEVRPVQKTITVFE